MQRILFMLMLQKSVLPVVGCVLLFCCSCSKLEPPVDDSSTSVAETEPAAESSTKETQKDQSVQAKSPKTTETQEPEASDGPGVKVGEKAPAFKLKDQNGKEQSLEDLVKKSGVALVFYRSADW
jgi:hypothetical protein